MFPPVVGVWPSHPCVGLDGVRRVRQAGGVSDLANVCAVCSGAVVNDRSVGLLFVGKRWYFCSQTCRVAFKREPERWVAERPEAGVVVAPEGALPRTRVTSPFKIR